MFAEENKKITFLNETENALKAQGYEWSDVSSILVDGKVTGDYRDDLYEDVVERWLVTHDNGKIEGCKRISADRFRQLADFEYDNTTGTSKVNPTIVIFMRNGTYFVRKNEQRKVYGPKGWEERCFVESWTYFRPFSEWETGTEFEDDAIQTLEAKQEK